MLCMCRSTTVFYCYRGVLSFYTTLEFHQLYSCSSQNEYTRSNAIWYQFHPGFISIHRCIYLWCLYFSKYHRIADRIPAPVQKKNRVAPPQRGWSSGSDTICLCVVLLTTSQFVLSVSLSLQETASCDSALHKLRATLKAHSSPACNSVNSGTRSRATSHGSSSL